MTATGLLLIGCGKMGGAMLAGWLDRAEALPPAVRPVTVVEPDAEAARAFAGRPGLTWHPALPPAGTTAPPAVALLAVKPQVADAVLPPYRAVLGPETVLLSVAAGKTIAGLGRPLAPGQPIVRAMPNTPAAIGRGITVMCPNPQVTPAQRTLCATLLAAVGAVDWVEDEALMDAVTAVSGSGPAYVFLLAECLAEAGAKAGLPDDLTARLARATVAGAGEMLGRMPEDPATLRRNVTSPQGTTAAALAVLMRDPGLAALMAEAVAAAATRSRALAS